MRTPSLILSIFLVLALAVTACGPAEDPDPDPDPVDVDDDKVGGTLRLAFIGESPSLDPHWTTAVITRQISMHIFEQLFVLNEDFEPVPFLAEDYSLSDDGLVYEFYLQEGVMFHNGKEMTAEDVVATLERWGGKATQARTAFGPKESLEAVDDYTVRLTLSEPSGTVLFALAEPGQFSGIMPKDIIEQFGDGEVTEYIGTGPFEFVEWLPDRHVKVKRFEDYWGGPDEEPSGLAGRRTAYVDEILFIPVPDESVRIAGVEGGEYHFGAFVTADEFERMEALPNVLNHIVKPRGYGVNIFNTEREPFNDVRMRRAVLAAYEQESVLYGAFGQPEFFRLNSCVMPEESPWHTTVGLDRYSQDDPDRARQLAEEAGYAGEEFRLMTTAEYDWMYRKDIVVEEQLRRADFNVKLKVVDWATLVTDRNDPDQYEMFTTGMVLNIHPVQNLFIPGWTGWPGWYQNEEVDELLRDLFYREVEFDAQYAAWEQVMDIFYDDVPAVVHGDYFGLNILHADAQGYAFFPYEFFWNVWLD